MTYAPHPTQMSAIQLDHFFYQITEALTTETLTFFGGVAEAWCVDAAVWDEPYYGAGPPHTPADTRLWTALDLVKYYKKLSGWTALTTVCAARELTLYDLQPTSLSFKEPTRIVVTMAEGICNTPFHRNLRRQTSLIELNSYALAVRVQPTADVIPLSVRTNAPWPADAAVSACFRTGTAR